MAEETKKLLAHALKLPLHSRAMIAEKLLESLENQEGLDAGIEEGERRWQAFKNGKMKAMNIAEVFSNLAEKKGRTMRGTSFSSKPLKLDENMTKK